MIQWTEWNKTCAGLNSCYTIAMQPTTPFRRIKSGNPALAKKIEEQGYFLLMGDVNEIEKIDRFIPVLVRCGNGRFTCAAQYVNHFCEVIGQSKTEYVRDLSVTN
jgi:hypothetical protein